MIQSIQCPCGVTFAACLVPECYTEKEWMNDLRKYVTKKNCTVHMVEAISNIFGSCTCPNMNPENKSKTQPELF